ncbi:MAG: N-formylglutamate amidohydrolase [Pseudomonadota bacterium]
MSVEIKVPSILTSHSTDMNAFSQLLPERQSLPVVVNSPHSGRYYPETFLEASRLNKLSIRKSEDFLVDELVKTAVDFGIPVLSAVYPRAYLDVNREPFELDPSMFDGELPGNVNTRSIRVSSGLGTIARIVSEGEEIYSQRLPASEAVNRIANIYRPYHTALQNLLARTHVDFGFAILLDVHSMPSNSAASVQENRGDIVLGDRFGSSCDARILHQAKAIFQSLGYQVEINRPYAGGFITEHYGRPFNGLHALQIEVNRALYMDEIRIARSRSFENLALDFGHFFSEFSKMDMSSFEGSKPLAAE